MIFYFSITKFWPLYWPVIFKIRLTKDKIGSAIAFDFFFMLQYYFSYSGSYHEKVYLPWNQYGWIGILKWL